MSESDHVSPPGIAEPGAEPTRSDLQRAFMDRARRAVEREQEEGPSRLLRNLLALLAASALALIMFFAFDAFLSGMQRVMHRLEQQEQQELLRRAQEEAERKRKEPIPAYVVPSE